MFGVEAFRDGQHTPFLAAFPDLRVTVEGTVGEGDNVVVRWLATGTHTGEGLGLPPTGKHISIRGMTWIRFENGKMAEGWDCWNLGGLMQTLREAAAQPS
ncbi:MAG TPA: ester cyclase [Gemmataceae bacterium]